MDNTFWLNLPSKDLNKARAFYEKIGCTINTQHSGQQMLGLLVGSQKIPINFFPEENFKMFIGGQAVTNASQSNETLLSIGFNSAKEVDLFAEKVIAAGGTLYAKPAEKDGWMYGGGFVDLDGHRWNMLYMDMSKLPKS